MEVFMLLQVVKMVKVAMLQKGKKVKLSKSDILDYSINLIEVKRRVSDEKYEEILQVYKEFSNDRKRVEMDLSTYESTIDNMMKRFEEVENR